MRHRKIAFTILFCTLVTIALAACGSQPTPAPTAIRLPSSTPSPLPTNTPEPTATAIRTPPALPAAFQTGELNPVDIPHTYIADECQYLKDKWTSTNSTPGTVLMPVMFHSITKEGVTNANQISLSDFHILMKDLHDQGFEAIRMQQAADFMEHNARIPAKSVLLIVDDRHYDQYFNEFFRDYHEKWGWPVINAFISSPENTQELWDQNAALEKEGWVDHQAHGVVHNIPIGSDSTDEYILGELQGSITAFQKYLGKAPIAYIWPGGGFTAHAADIAGQLGYQLGFTVNPRGPVMYNWIPLADSPDANRPLLLAEGGVKNLLLVLPRYWDTDADLHIDQVRRIGEQATKYASQSKDTELEYYSIMCEPKYGVMP